MPAVNRTKYHVVPRMSLMTKLCMIAAPAAGGYVLALLTILPWTLK